MACARLTDRDIAKTFGASCKVKERELPYVLCVFSTPLFPPFDTHIYKYVLYVSISRGLSHSWKGNSGFCIVVFTAWERDILVLCMIRLVQVHIHDISFWFIIRYVYGGHLRSLCDRLVLREPARGVCDDEKYCEKRNTTTGRCCASRTFFAIILHEYHGEGDGSVRIRPH